jgi:hypothetical protein
VRRYRTHDAEALSSLSLAYSWAQRGGERSHNTGSERSVPAPGSSIGIGAQPTSARGEPQSIRLLAVPVHYVNETKLQWERAAPRAR